MVSSVVFMLDLIGTESNYLVHLTDFNVETKLIVYEAHMMLQLYHGL